MVSVNSKENARWYKITENYDLYPIKKISSNKKKKHLQLNSLIFYV